MSLNSKTSLLPRLLSFPSSPYGRASMNFIPSPLGRASSNLLLLLVFSLYVYWYGPRTVVQIKTRGQRFLFARILFSNLLPVVKVGFYQLDSALFSILSVGFRTREWKDIPGQRFLICLFLIKNVQNQSPRQFWKVYQPSSSADGLEEAGKKSKYLLWSGSVCRSYYISSPVGQSLSLAPDLSQNMI